MTDFPILRDLGYILIAAAGTVLVARRAGVPAIIAYIATGLVLGPATHLLHPDSNMELIAETGIALLLFLVGLEMSLQKIRDVGRVAVLAGVGQIAMTAALGFGLGLLLGFEPLPALVLAAGLTFSSTVVVVKLLEQRGDLNALHGRIAVGILLVQDVAVVIALTLLAGLETPGALGFAEVGRSLGRAFLGMAGLVMAAYVGSRYLLPGVLRWLGASLEALFIWSLAWCFALILMAGALGLSIELGAFMAGVGLAQLRYSEELRRRVHPLVNFFLAVFFVTLGAHMQLGAAVAAWPAVLGLSIFVLIGKPAILMALIPRFGHGERASFLSALTLGQISEFSFILAASALAAGLVDAAFVSVVSAIGLVTIGVSTALIQGGDRVYRGLHGLGVLRVFRAPPAAEPAAAPELRDHVIVVGMNTLGRKLVRQLCGRGERVLAVDVDAAKLEGLPCRTLQGNADHPSVLEHANLPAAKLLVSALQIQDANNLLAYRAREAGVPSSIHAFDPALVPELEARGATHLMVSKYDGIRQMVEVLRKMEGIG
ncbi:MAG: cation:proton antiporter [Gemmatimonadota bacterium]